MRHRSQIFLVPVLCLAMVASACGASATATPTTLPMPTSAPTAAGAKATPTAAAVPAATTTTAAMPKATSTQAPVVNATATAAVAKPAATATTAPVGPTSVPAAGGNTPQVLADTQRALLNTKGYRAKSTTTSDKGTTTENTIEFQPPDRMHSITSGVEMIVVRGSGAWQKTAGGQWTSMPNGQAIADSMLSTMDEAQIASMMQSIVIDKFRQDVTELLDGKLMRVYEYATHIDMGGTAADSTSKIWIGALDGLPYKSVGDATLTGGIQSKTNTTTIYEYDPTINIKPPM